MSENTNAGGGETEIRLPLCTITSESLLRDAYAQFGSLSADFVWGANFALDRIATALSAQSTGSGGVAAEPVARQELAQIRAMLLSGQADDAGSQILPDFDEGMSVAAMVSRCIHLLEQRRDVLDAQKFKPDETGTRRSRLEAEGWSQASVVSCYWISAKPDHELVPVVNLDLRKLYEATHELAAAPTPPAGGGETENGDLNSLSARATPGEWCGRLFFTLPEADSDFCDALVNAYRSGRLVEAAPAAPRKGPSEEEIARLIQNAMAEHLGLDSDNDIVGTGPASYQASRRILALLTPADRGETPAVGDDLDAERFRALMRCGRIKMQGSTGVDHVTGERRFLEPPGMVHFGAEFWPQADGPADKSTIWGRHCLRALADDILALEGSSPDQNRGEPDQGGANTEAGR